MEDQNTTRHFHINLGILVFDVLFIPHCVMCLMWPADWNNNTRQVSFHNTHPIYFRKYFRLSRMVHPSMVASAVATGVAASWLVHQKTSWWRVTAEQEVSPAGVKLPRAYFIIRLVWIFVPKVTWQPGSKVWSWGGQARSWVCWRWN